MSGETLRILLLLPYAWDRVPGQRYRIEQWLPLLKDSGIHADVRPLMTRDELTVLHESRSLPRKMAVVAKSFARALGAFPHLRRYDVLYLYRTLLVGGPALLERGMGAAGPPIVYDFDDAIWLTKTTDANRALSFLKFSGKTARIIGMARAVITSNETLARYARTRCDDVTIVPSTVDTDRYTPREHSAPSQRLVVGWSGSPTTIQYMEVAAPALQRLAAEMDFELRIMGADYALTGVRVTCVPWSPSQEIEELRRYDIGLMPVADDPWTRGKGAMKALLYMSVGVPTVASPVGVTTEIVQHGRNGLLASNAEEWYAGLKALAASVDRRRVLGAAGRRTVEERFSAKVQVPRVVEVLRRAAAREP